jgi:GT2 family glycosyltransferase
VSAQPPKQQTPRFACVVLTQGQRPAVLQRALDSLLRQEGVEVEVVVVGNAWEPEGLPPQVKGVGLPQDVGIPGGRNAGVPHAHGDLLFFLDDDASLEQPDALARIARLFDEQPDIGLVQLRVEPLEGGTGPRDWVPRLRASTREKSGDITLVWEGAVAMPRRLFEEIGGWDASYRFVHEGVDLAWRVMDQGYRVYYEAGLAALHPLPVKDPSRHNYSRYYGARNRVWMARRHLPLPLGVLYVATFAARTLPLLLRSPADIKPALRGYRAGMREPCGARRKLRARTLLRMTRTGRPPII